MEDLGVIVCGLPQSGKTTFLAALWHLVTYRELPSKMRLESLLGGDKAHLNALAERWRGAKRQERTQLAPRRIVSMRLQDESGASLRLTFPDLSGEVYSRMWELRECEQSTIELLRASPYVLLFIHSDTIDAPNWVVNVAALSQKLGIPIEEGQEIPWQPKIAPTQVQLVGLLQLLTMSPLDIGPRRLAIMFSAWDKIEIEGLSPSDFLATRLPLLHQYLVQGADKWLWKAFGISAQGGEYEPGPESKEVLTPEEVQEVKALQSLDNASTRIKVVTDTHKSHDLTEPISWLKN